MTLDILTSCNGHISKIQPLLDALAVQTVQAERILILIYTQITKDEHEMFLYYIQRLYDEEFFAKIITFSHLNSDHEPGNGHGYDRDFLMRQAKSEYSFLIDCDNTFKPECVEELLVRQHKIQKELARNVIVSPTIMRRQSGIVQSQGIVGFRFWMPKYEYKSLGAQHRQEVKMIGGNSLLGPTKLFQSVGFDTRFANSYEDIDFSYRCWLSGHPIVIVNKVETYHMERTKTKLEKMFLGTALSAWYRSRNRVLFVSKNATKWEKIQYFGLGLRAQTAWFFIQIGLHAGQPFFKKRKLLRKAVWQGTMEGLRRN